jgi:hypothetical protein
MKTAIIGIIALIVGVGIGVGALNASRGSPSTSSGAAPQLATVQAAPPAATAKLGTTAPASTAVVTSADQPLTTAQPAETVQVAATPTESTVSSAPLTFQGNDNTNTQPFTLNGNYTLEWTATPSGRSNTAFCAIVLTPTEGRGVTSTNSLISKILQGAESGTTQIYNAKGDYYFRMNGCGDWTLSVLPLGATATAPSTPSTGAAAAATLPADGAASSVVVNKPFGAALRAQPSSDASILASVGCATVLQVVGPVQAGWFLVQSGTTQGWVGGARVVPGSTPDAGACEGAPNKPFTIGQTVQASVASGCLSVRSSPSVNASMVGCVPSGSKFVLTNGPMDVAGEDWYAVRSATGGPEGWTRAAYLQP